MPSGAFAQGAGPETTKATLGSIALTDAAPLIVVEERGLFSEHGRPDTEIAKQASWGGAGGIETTFDGKTFVAANPAAHLAAQSIEKMAAA